MIFYATAAWLVLINLITYADFAADKRAAVTGGWRAPEARLLFLALIGGWPGAKLAQRHYRHKTRKMPFARRLNAVAILQILLLACTLTVWSRSPTFDLRPSIAAMIGGEQ